MIKKSVHCGNQPLNNEKFIIFWETNQNWVCMTEVGVGNGGGYVFEKDEKCGIYKDDHRYIGGIPVHEQCYNKLEEKL